MHVKITVIEFARDVCGFKDANSGEFDEHSQHKVIDFLPDQNDQINKGGTLRLGAYPCLVQNNTVLSRCYRQKTISERHRHRYEFNNEYRDILVKNGLVIGGTSPDGYIVETVEIPSHRFFVGVQFHPEFKSRPNRPHPIFLEFIGSSLNMKK